MRTFGEFCFDLGLERDDAALQRYLVEEAKETNRTPAKGLYRKTNHPCGCDGSRPCGGDGCDCCLAWSEEEYWIPYELMCFNPEQGYPDGYLDNWFVQCPYCGHVEGEGCELCYRNEETEHECENCGEKFVIVPEISIEYSTDRAMGRSALSPARYFPEGCKPCEHCGNALTPETFSHKYTDKLPYCNECFEMLSKRKL